MEAARLAGVDKFVFTSSGGSIYGTPAALPVDESQPLSPESQYAAGKAACELYLNVYRAAYGLRSSSLALANVYGPRQDPHGEAGVVAIFSTAMLLGRPTKIFGDGSQIRDYVFVGDVAEAFASACVPGAGDGRRFNIGTGSQTSVCDLHYTDREDGRECPTNRCSPRLGWVSFRRSRSTARWPRRELGWRPRRVLGEGIVETVDWIRLPAGHLSSALPQRTRARAVRCSGACRGSPCASRGRAASGSSSPPVPPCFRLAVLGCLRLAVCSRVFPARVLGWLSS